MEDDGEPWSSRVGLYWSARASTISTASTAGALVGGLHQLDHAPIGAQQQPVPRLRCPLALHPAFREPPPSSGSIFLPHKITDYAPRPGDLICATRGSHGFIPVYDASPASVLSSHTKLHCDLVTGRKAISWRRSAQCPQLGLQIPVHPYQPGPPATHRTPPMVRRAGKPSGQPGSEAYTAKLLVNLSVHPEKQRLRR